MKQNRLLRTVSYTHLNLKKAQAEAEALALAEEQAKYESKDLKDALADTSMTAEEFGQKFQKAVGENLQSHFGDVKLSMQEIQDIARKMTFGDNIEAVTKFSDASAEVEQLSLIHICTRSSGFVP